jgi:hypothetical protein
MREAHVYVQDTWKASRNLTISGGLIWEKTKPSQPSEGATNTVYYNTNTIPSRTLNLTPRASLAYLFSPRTAFRASYGWYYAPYTGQVVDALFLGNGIYQTSISVNPNQTGALVFPKVFAPTATLPNGTTNILFAESKFRQPYTQQATAAIERRLTKDTDQSRLKHTPSRMPATRRQAPSPPTSIPPGTMRPWRTFSSSLTADRPGITR